ncbi:MAG: hypothetical protein ACK6CP_20940 [Pseudanabaena sp.]|nr:hypothetical protein [Pseudanabaena sp. M090S1SP2A07QC]MCA6505809.1 hypothetical protein [Pseudanabaena sp. M172S2SP2A07QC]MCA6521573.1 hypothetical protein [Pseudanabaena sp. M051S1SP2A07QC]MCA6525286.1 hypothetical protein [Pseudanabaena sp. M179S2SP2A07QC]MCA6528403.1 hypothetical protein [Pseudanabaena sp. M125S2SP2A07QC]MCA6533687.1 hypothetical protein [Pseudanabaena sp. M176S2SP2A07QC]MCA6539427.1 hypothetical protein [Pseudanabaena sp. M037S2SP2A07QC]MCA6542546.1 hypothetical prot
MTFTELLPNLQRLDPSDKLRAIQFLVNELSKTENFASDDIESKSWLEADLVSDLPEYDWGEGGIPSMKPVEYVSGIGLVLKAG